MGDYRTLYRRTPTRDVVMFYSRIPRYAQLEQSPMAQLSALVASFGGKQKPSDFYVGWAAMGEGREKEAERYSEAVVSSVELAFALGLLSQGALAALGAETLRASGAWAKGS